MHPISSKLWANAQGYGLDGYCRIQVAKGNISILCMKLRDVLIIESAAPYIGWFIVYLITLLEVQCGQTYVIN